MKVDIDKDTQIINKIILKSVHTQLKVEAATNSISENYLVNFKLGEPINKDNLKNYKKNLPVIKN